MQQKMSPNSILRVFILGFLLAAIAPHSVTSLAQSNSPDDLLMYAVNNDGTSTHEYIYGPQGGKPIKELPSDYEVSNPIARYAIKAGVEKNSYTVVDLKTTKTVRSFNIGDSLGYTPALSPSTRYLAYDEISSANDGTQWALHIVDLSTNKEWQFADTLDSSLQNKVNRKFLGTPFLVGWDSTETTVVLVAIWPYTDAGIRGYFLLNLNKVAQSDKPATLPALTTLPFTRDLLISADNTQAVFLTEDDNNAAPDWEATHGSDGPYNTVDLVTLTTAKITVVAKAAKGISLDKLSWSQDGKRLYFVSGRYLSTDYIHNPVLNYVDLVSKKVTVGNALYSDRTDKLSDLIVCDNTVYYMTIPADGLLNDATAWTTPLKDMTPVQLALPDSSLYYSLNGCIAPSK